MEGKIRKNNILYPELSYLVCGLCFKVHNELGRYRNEKQYGDYLEKLFSDEKMKYKREFSLPASFSGEQERRNIVDFIIENKIILEIKAKRIISKEDYYQTKRYLTSCGLELGLLVNFREYYLKPKRILNSKNL